MQRKSVVNRIPKRINNIPMPEEKTGPRRYGWHKSGRRNTKEHLAEVKAFLRTFIHYPNQTDDEILDFCLLPFVTLHWTHSNPIWLQVIGPPGSGKTAHVTLTKDYPKSIFVSSLSKATLISGYRKEGDDDFDPSLLPLLNEKVLIVKDFTTILQSSKDERDAVIGQLRDIFDGHASRGLGNVGLMEYVSRFNMLLCVTPAIDQYHSIGQQLGERFISRREYAVNRSQITKAAIRNVISGKESANFKIARNMVHGFIDKVPQANISDIVFSDAVLTAIERSCDFAARARSHVYRERDGRSIASRPSPEVATRLATQIVQCIAGYCLINGIEKVNNKAWQFGGARVIRDTLPSIVSWVLYNLFHHFPLLVDNKTGIKKFFVSTDVAKITRLGNYVVDQVLTDLYCHGILEKKSDCGATYEYYFNEEAYLTITRYGLFEKSPEYLT